LAANQQIGDVIVSGGDPLTLTDQRLEEIFSILRAVPSVQILRLGTRAPVVCPQRITSALVKMLRAFQPLYIMTHFNHPREITPQAVRACAMLVEAGLPVLNQSVLLKGINDDCDTLKTLSKELLKARVLPYYLHQCDLVMGTEHFRVQTARGIQLQASMRGYCSGLGVPTYVLDVPGGAGKIPLQANYLLGSADGITKLRTYQGLLADYPEPLSR
jgi:lysine 2,3-aminomutase